MKRNAVLLRAFVYVLTATALCFAQQPDAKYADPQRFQEDILRFEQADSTNPPPVGAVLCIGSSSMRMWHDSIKVDLAPLTVIARGFGGSTMFDVLHFADRIVLPYQPRAILLYEGDNDIAGDIAPQKIHDTFVALVDLVHAALPATRFYVLSIKPSISREAMWPQMQVANKLLSDECAGDERLTFVDVATGMLNAERDIRSDIFVEDNLHMNRKGYLIWRDLVRRALAPELAIEKTE